MKELSLRMSSDILEEETLWTLRWSDIYWSLKVWYLCSAYGGLKRASFPRNGGVLEKSLECQVEEIQNEEKSVYLMPCNCHIDQLLRQESDLQWSRGECSYTPVGGSWVKMSDHPKLEHRLQIFPSEQSGSHRNILGRDLFLCFLVLYDFLGRSWFHCLQEKTPGCIRGYHMPLGVTQSHTTVPQSSLSVCK